jgi:hypothetical protein
MISHPNHEAIQRLLTQFRALLSEYETKFTTYTQIKDTYIDELQKVNGGNPCGTYSGTFNPVSQSCYNKIWSDHKCTTTAPTVDSTKTFSELVTYVFGISKSADQKTLCYGAAPAPPAIDNRIINTDNNPIANGRDANFATKINNTWDRTTGSIVSSGATGSVDDCLQACASRSGCTGATYDTTSTTTKTCSLVVGSGKLTATEAKDGKKTAIYMKLSDFSNQLNASYQELFTIITNLEAKRTEIQRLIGDGTGSGIMYELNTLTENELRIKYEDLNTEKSILRELLNNRNVIEASYKSENNMVHDEKIRLRFWSIIAVIIVLFFIKYFFGFDSLSINVIFFITIFIVLGLTLSSPSGFAAMGILFLVFLVLILFR